MSLVSILIKAYLVRFNGEGGGLATNVDVMVHGNGIIGQSVNKKRREFDH